MAINYRTLKFARQMRHKPARAELILWNKLRNRTLSGFKFSRQVPVGCYIVDFVCRELKLIIEVDGATHSDPDELCHDELRTVWLEGQGYSIYRIWNQDVYENLDGVLNSILMLLKAAPHPARLRERPSPQRVGARTALISPFSPLGRRCPKGG